MTAPTDATQAERRTPTLAEVLVVLGLPVGLFVAKSIWAVHTSSAVPARTSFTDASLLRVLAVEVLLAAGLLTWLGARGWHVRRQLGRLRWADLWRGGLLWAATLCFGMLAAAVIGTVWPALQASAHDLPLAGSLSWWVVGLALLINPVFEETLWLGYAVPALTPRIGLAGAVTVSILLRVGVHYNQGAHALLSVLPVALSFTIYYLLARRIWPVVIAHIIVNGVGMGEMVAGAS